MKRYKGLMLSLAFILVLSTALAGCGSSQNAAETTGDTQGTENSADADEKITLTFLHNTPKSEINQGEGKTFYAQMDKFRAKHPNVEIKDEGYPSADYRTKIKTLAAANELPDMFFLEASLVPNFADNGLIEPINDIVENADWTENFMNDAFDDMTYNGDIYGIPSDMKATSLIFYNKEIFAEAGITSFPETWEEFKEAVVKLKDAGYIPIAMGNKDKWVLESCLLSTLGDRYTGPGMVLQRT